jgi:melibiose permease
MIFYPLIRKFLSSIKVFYVSFAMAIAGYSILLIMMFCNVTSIYMLFIPGFFVFAAFGMLTVLTTVFLANTVDYGEWKNHRRDESVIFSMQTFVVKLASGVAAMIATICLTFSNINQDTSETMVDATIATATSGQNVAVLRMTMTIAPIIGLLIALFIFAKKYILTDEKLDEIKIKLQH